MSRIRRTLLLYIVLCQALSCAAGGETRWFEFWSLNWLLATAPLRLSTVPPGGLSTCADTADLPLAQQTPDIHCSTTLLLGTKPHAVFHTQVPFIRLGRQATAHPGVHRFMPGGAAYPDRSTAALAAVMDSVGGALSIVTKSRAIMIPSSPLHCPASLTVNSHNTPASLPQVRVVGVPCLSCNAPLLAGRSFDVAVIDEAGQITLPAVLGPLMISSSFVLVG